MEKSTFNIFQLPDDGKKFGSLIKSLSEKPGTMEYKIYGKMIAIYYFCLIKNRKFI